MAETYKELLDQRRALEQRIAKARQSETQAAIAQARELIEQYELQAEDVFPTRRGRAASGSGVERERKTVEPKYRHPQTGATWTGRGKPPRWIADANNREDYRIAA